MKPAEPLKQEEEIEETSINMAALFYISLDKMNTEADLAYLRNDILGWYKGLNRVFKRAIIKLSDKERDGLIDKFKEAREKLEANRRDKEIPGLLNTIDLELMRVMHKYGMIMPRMRVKGFDKVKERFQLKDEQER